MPARWRHSSPTVRQLVLRYMHSMARSWYCLAAVDALFHRVGHTATCVQLTCQLRCCALQDATRKGPRQAGSQLCCISEGDRCKHEWHCGSCCQQHARNAVSTSASTTAAEAPLHGCAAGCTVSEHVPPGILSILLLGTNLRTRLQLLPVLLLLAAGPVQAWGACGPHPPHHCPLRLFQPSTSSARMRRQRRHWRCRHPAPAAYAEPHVHVPREPASTERHGCADSGRAVWT
jgi:hypothetical protein